MKKQIALGVGLLAADQISKWIVSQTLLLGERNEIIPHFFSLTYLHNTGAAWSMFEGQMGFFMIVSIVALLLMIGFYKGTEKDDILTKYGLVLMMSGTIGNLIDRVCFHYVRDFLDFIILGYDFPVFNIADMALCIGVGLIMLSIVLESLYGGYRKCVK